MLVFILNSFRKKKKKNLAKKNPQPLVCQKAWRHLHGLLATPQQSFTTMC